MKSSRYTFSMIIVMLVALIVAACGGPSTSSNPSSAPGSTPTTAGWSHSNRAIQRSQSRRSRRNGHRAWKIGEGPRQCCW